MRRMYYIGAEHMLDKATCGAQCLWKRNRSVAMTDRGDCNRDPQ
jgi:hypothetical protein